MVLDWDAIGRMAPPRGGTGGGAGGVGGAAARMGTDLSKRKLPRWSTSAKTVMNSEDKASMIRTNVHNHVSAYTRTNDC